MSAHLVRFTAVGVVFFLLFLAGFLFSSVKPAEFFTSGVFSVAFVFLRLFLYGLEVMISDVVFLKMLVRTFGRLTGTGATSATDTLL